MNKIYYILLTFKPFFVKIFRIPESAFIFRQFLHWCNSSRVEFETQIPASFVSHFNIFFIRILMLCLEWGRSNFPHLKTRSNFAF